MGNSVIGWLSSKPVPDNYSFTDYLTTSRGNLVLDGLDLYEVVSKGLGDDKFFSPLEVVYLPIIREKIVFLVNAFEQAINDTKYGGKFLYTYASKANAAEEVIRTIIETGVNLEISSWVDVEIVNHMGQKNLLPDDKLIICNGFKQPGSMYADRILKLRSLRKNVIPVIENEAEISTFVNSEYQFDVGLRLKSYGNHIDLAAMNSANSRFGLDLKGISNAAELIDDSPNLNLRLFHAMVGSQITDEKEFVKRLTPAIQTYAQLRQKYDTLEIFDFGGGIPVQQTLDFSFDYKLTARLLLSKIKEICNQYHVPVPTVMGEMGRYTVAEHGAHIFKVIAVKENNSNLPWYIIDGSIMSSFPDTWALGENFIVLPINHLDQPFQEVQLGGITCDSDDIYPSSSSNSSLFLPEKTEDLYIGFFNIGAYQEMLGGAGGSKHCVIPEADELIVDKKLDGNFVFTKLNGQSADNVLRNLGYR